MLDSNRNWDNGLVERWMERKVLKRRELDVLGLVWGGGGGVERMKL